MFLNEKEEPVNEKEEPGLLKNEHPVLCKWPILAHGGKALGSYYSNKS
jgi:hypothetical protein